MKRIMQVVLGLGLGWAVALMSAAPLTPAFAKGTLVVDDDMSCAGAQYATIQEAVLDATPGSKIKVCPGTYEGPVVIDNLSKLKLLAQKGGPVIINAPGDPPESFDGAIVSVTNSQGVTIQGFTIDGAEQFAPGAITIQGIFFQNSSGTIAKNTVARIREPGLGFDEELGQGILVLDPTGPVKIMSNTVTDFQALGIEVFGGVKPPVISKNITVSDASNDTDPVGIVIDHTPGGKITKNTVTSNWSPDNDFFVEGIVIVNVSKATISGNVINNQMMALWMHSYCTEDGMTATVEKNKVSGNRMMNSAVGIAIEARDDGLAVCTSVTVNNKFSGNKLYAPSPLPVNFAGIWLNADLDQVVAGNKFSGNTVSGYDGAAISWSGDADMADQIFSSSNHWLPAPPPPHSMPVRDLSKLFGKLDH